jgi:hypothetical protein
MHKLVAKWLLVGPGLHISSCSGKVAVRSKTRLDTSCNGAQGVPRELISHLHYMTDKHIVFRKAVGFLLKPAYTIP